MGELLVTFQALAPAPTTSTSAAAPSTTDPPLTTTTGAPSQPNFYGRMVLLQPRSCGSFIMHSNPKQSWSGDL